MAIDWKTWGPIIAGAGTTAVGAYLGNRRANKEDELRQQEIEQGRLFSEEQSRQSTALTEAGRDPFRDQVSQASALSRLDMIANAQNTRTRIDVPGDMARFVPKISGGFSYNASPDLRTSARRLQQDVATGRGAPTMTDPANYGRTGAVNLNDPMAAAGPAVAGAAGVGTRPAGSAVPRAPGGAGASGVPGVSGGAGAAAVDPMSDDFLSSALSSYERRNEGAGGVGAGIKKGAGVGLAAAKFVGPYAPLAIAGGVVIGGIAGAITKNAKTAMTDLSVTDASSAIADTYRQYLGRDPSPEEVASQLGAQGLKAGHKWVGEAGLMAVLRSIATSAESQGRKAPAAAPDSGMTPSYSGLFAA